jgi:hypothetical protein
MNKEVSEDSYCTTDEGDKGNDSAKEEETYKSKMEEEIKNEKEGNTVKLRKEAIKKTVLHVNSH